MKGSVTATISVPLRADAFVGRGEELDFLHRRALEAFGGRAALIVISGDRGIGKTRLLDEFFARHSQALRAARVRCSSWMREADDVVIALCEALASLLRKDPPENLEAGRALAYARNCIRAARRSGPLVLAIEDVQYATRLVIDTLEELGSIGNCLVVLTVAPEEASPEIREALARLCARTASEIRLAPLSAEAVRRMIRRMRDATAALPRPLVSQIIAVSGGNPSLAEDLVRTAAEQGAQTVTVPLAMQVRARRQFDTLNEQARHLLLIAAALGAEFEARLLSRVADRKLADVLDALQDAVLAGLVRETGAKTFAFAHPLLREALRAETAPSFAARYHRRAALLLQRTAKTIDHFETVAEQWRGAQQHEQCTVWEERAGDAAMEHADFVRAAAAYRRGLRHCSDTAVSRRLLLKRANGLRRSGLEREALEAFDEYLAVSAGDPAETIGRVLLHKMVLLWSAGEFTAAESLADQVFALALPAESDVKALALVQLAGQRWTSGKLEEAKELLQRVEREHRMKDPEALGKFYHQRALLTYSSGIFEDAEEDFRRGISFMERSNNGPLYVQHLCNFGNVALLHARNDLAIRMLARACEAARTVASETKIHFALSSYARALMRVGRNAQALAVIKELEKSDAELTELNAFSSAVVMLELGSMLEDPSLIERALDGDALELASQSGQPQRVLTVAGAVALHQWHAGNEEDARGLLHRALHAAESVSWNYSFAVLVAQFGEMQDVPRARRMLQPPLVVGDARVTAPFLDLFDAFVARRRGRNAAAASVGRRAAKNFGAIGWPYFEAQALEVAGDHTAALRIYDAVGDVRDAKKLRAALRPLRSSGRHAVALTPREREVGLLALDGLSSAAIAERLGIGRRTVEHHLQILYGKFGIRSRWQLPRDL